MPQPKLPNEVLTLVLKNALRDDSGFLISPTSFNLVSRLFRATVEPLQYERILSDNNGRTINIVLLVRSIANRPELGIHIKHIEVQGIWPEYVGVRGIGRKELCIWARIGSSLDSRRYGLWERELQRGNPDAYMVLLLSFATRLQTLAPGIHHSPFLNQMCEAVERATTLTRLDYGTTNFLEGRLFLYYSRRNLVPLFSPSRISWARIRIWDWSILPFEYNQVQALSLKTLYLTVCFMDLAKLGPVFRAIPNLETLNVDLFIGGTSAQPALKWLDCSQLCEALSQLSPQSTPVSGGGISKLKKLTISAKFTEQYTILGGPWEDILSMRVNGQLGPLKFLDSLQYLEVDPLCLFGRNVQEAALLCELVPHSLKTLRLTAGLDKHYVNCKYEWRVLGMRQYFEKHQASLGKSLLKEITIYSMTMENTIENVQALWTCLKDAGIDPRIWVRQDVVNGIPSHLFEEDNSDELSDQGGVLQTPEASRSITSNDV